MFFIFFGIWYSNGLMFSNHGTHILHSGFRYLRELLFFQYAIQRNFCSLSVVLAYIRS